jgi:outer membrane protein TolC
METPDLPEESFNSNVENLINQALANRPDLQAARTLFDISEAKVDQARSRALPSISATGSYNRIWINDFTDFNDTYSVGLNLQIPLFNGFSRQYDLLMAKADVDAAREHVRGFEQNVIFQVYTSHSNYLTASERLKTSDDLVASATESEEVALGRYKEGVGNILELLSAQRALANARAMHINARFGWFIALSQLAHDVGILNEQGNNPLTLKTGLSR